ncbi:GGDEF domain-containing protein [Moritella yayanosii]|uniref:GGDEF domain-containing protein n=1 Tax=Moritella yayanosii TaxID=69539 RepID=A0A330LLT2_9GAMM|nr:diguanylate cyclase [Moritella yayanosii]SQD77994.1 protein of unknown function [Moritella yayanosii]
MRYCREGFVLIGFFENEMSAIDMADIIRHQVSEVYFINDNNEFNVTLSAGVTLHNNLIDDSFENTLKRADLKLYEAKQQVEIALLFN